MASLFAFCANSNSPGFQGMKEVSMFTVGAPAVSKTPLYNGQPGNCFNGIRTSAYTGSLPPQPQFYIDVAQWFRSLMEGMGASTNDVDQGISMMKSLLAADNVAQFEQVKAQIMPAFNPLYLPMVLIAKNITIPGMESLMPMYPTLLGQLVQVVMGNLAGVSIPYDPVPALWIPLGFVHPMVSYQPVPLWVAPAASNPPLATCDSDVVALPASDPAQTFLGTLLGEQMVGGFPNHGICCLTVDPSACLSMYNASEGIACSYVNINPNVIANIVVPSSSTQAPTQACEVPQSRDECREVAIAHGLVWDGTRNWVDREYGCLKTIGDNHVNWNFNSSGQDQNPDQTRFCL